MMNRHLQSKHQGIRKLDRKNAIKNIDYVATSSLSSLDNVVIPSFRVEGVEGDFDLICRSIGLSGPEDFAIPTADWEARKSPRGFDNRNLKSCELGSSRNSENFSVTGSNRDSFDDKNGKKGFDNRNSKSCELGNYRNSENFSVTGSNRDNFDDKNGDEGFGNRNSKSFELGNNWNSEKSRVTGLYRNDLVDTVEAKTNEKGFDCRDSGSCGLANNRKSENLRATGSNSGGLLETVVAKIGFRKTERNAIGSDNRNSRSRGSASNRNSKNFRATGSNRDGLLDSVEAKISVRKNKRNEKEFDNRNLEFCEWPYNQNQEKISATGSNRGAVLDSVEDKVRVENEGNENGFTQAENGVRVSDSDELKYDLGNRQNLESSEVIDSDRDKNSSETFELNVRVKECSRNVYELAPAKIEVRVKEWKRNENDTRDCNEEFSVASVAGRSQISVRSLRSGVGIKGARPPLLAPPPVISPSQNTDNTCSSWDLLRSFGPPSDEDSGSCIGNSLEERKTTAEPIDRVDLRRRDVDGEWLGDIRVVSEYCSDTSEDKDDDFTNVKMEPLHFVSPLGKFKCTINSWQKGDFLGSGSFGTVYEGFTDDGIFFAVKEVSLLDQGDQGKQSIYQLEQEIFFLSQFEHENIVQYLGTDKDNGKLYIFLELVTKGSLASLYQKYNLQDSQVSAYTRQILNGLNYLHLRKVVHRDIKCANILVDASGSVKLADFGLAKATNLNDVKSCKGTAFWMAPEVVNRKNHGYGLAADIWSLGCTVLEMLTRRVPYSHLEGMQALFRIGKGEPPLVPNSLSREARDFISKCLRVNPDDRSTAAQLLNHPFVKRPLVTFSAPPSPFQNGRRS